jgi:hypothetical protein
MSHRPLTNASSLKITAAYCARTNKNGTYLTQMSKCKGLGFYFNSKVVGLERLYGEKNHKNPSDQKLTLGHP